MASKPFSEYAERNCRPILAVLRREFATAASVLEIGSGTGQHAARFASEMPQLVWQTSDRIENHNGIRAWVEASALPNLLPPLQLDVLADDITKGPYDAVYSANTAHIMSIEAVHQMFRLVGKALPDGGIFCVYGPFRQGGKFNTASNANFHVSLQARDTEMGIRDIERLDDFGIESEMRRLRLYTMPANNHLAIWAKEAV